MRPRCSLFSQTVGRWPVGSSRFGGCISDDGTNLRAFIRNAAGQVTWTGVALTQEVMSDLTAGPLRERAID